VITYSGLMSVHEIEFRRVEAGVRGQNFQVSGGAALISNTREPRGIRRLRPLSTGRSLLIGSDNTSAFVRNNPTDS
jgi:hypothetical protein